MRTLQVGNEWPTERAGGLNSYFAEVIHALVAGGDHVEGLVVGSDAVRSKTGGRITAFARADDTLQKRLFSTRRAAEKILREMPVDLIVPHFALYGLPLLDRLRSKPSVVHFHGPWAAESNVEGSGGVAPKIKSLLEGLVYSSADRLIVLSRAFADELTKRYGVLERRIRIIPGGVDLARFNASLARAEARRQLGWPLDRCILLTVRRQVRRMGLETLIESVSSLVPQNPDLLLLLGGTGPLSSDLDRLIIERGLQNHVRRLGRISDEELPLAYRAADMTVVPSQALEGFGLITLESLASGTPVLVTPVGGLPEVLQSFAPECIFEGVGASHITAGLQAALVDRILPSEVACRSYCEDHFSWTKVAKQVRAVYEEVL